VHGRAEVLGRDGAHRGRYRLVTARGFGPPAATTECAAPLLEVGGRLIVSEPPGTAGERWPAGPLAQLGLTLARVVATRAAGFAVLEQVAPCPAEYPRRAGIPVKRPLFC
jgi:16S rRNA (guanine527-N7)-methyltransferase